jgi:hypothetical protein
MEPPQLQKVVYCELVDGGEGPVASAAKGDSSETGTPGAAANGEGDSAEFINYYKSKLIVVLLSSPSTASPGLTRVYIFF